MDIVYANRSITLTNEDQYTKHFLTQKYSINKNHFILNLPLNLSNASTPVSEAAVQVGQSTPDSEQTRGT